MLRLKRQYLPTALPEFGRSRSSEQTGLPDGMGVILSEEVVCSYEAILPGLIDTVVWDEVAEFDAGYLQAEVPPGERLRIVA